LALDWYYPGPVGNNLIQFIKDSVARIDFLQKCPKEAKSSNTTSVLPNQAHLSYFWQCISKNMIASLAYIIRVVSSVVVGDSLGFSLALC
jgi:hypothetical protein